MPVSRWALPSSPVTNLPSRVTAMAVLSGSAKYWLSPAMVLSCPLRQASANAPASGAVETRTRQPARLPASAALSPSTRSVFDGTTPMHMNAPSSAEAAGWGPRPPMILASAATLTSGPAHEHSRGSSLQISQRSSTSSSLPSHSSRVMRMDGGSTTLRVRAPPPLRREMLAWTRALGEDVRAEECVWRAGLDP